MKAVVCAALSPSPVFAQEPIEEVVEAVKWVLRRGRELIVPDARDRYPLREEAGGRLGGSPATL